MNTKKSQITLADLTRGVNPRYIVISTKNFVDYKIKSELTEIQVKDLVEYSTVDVIIRSLKDSDNI